MRTKAVFDNIAEHLEEQIDLAENKIVVAVAWFTNKRLFDALCKKASEGVKVKLIISDNEINRNSTINHSDIQIGKSKLYWIETHNKFCIIDDYILITGSYNWSYRAESNSENILICSGNFDLVKEYKNEVKKIIKDYSPENDINPKSCWEEAIKSEMIKPYISSSKIRDDNNPAVRPSTKKDFESIKIGKQEWMLKNLDVDRFRNGDLIPHIKEKGEWMKAGLNKQPAWCYYDNNPENGKIYGKLYNWHAVNDNRGLAPPGWHVPSDAEWIILRDYLGGEHSAGCKMISVGSPYSIKVYWKTTNSSGFSALPGGQVDMAFNFINIRGLARFWSNTDKASDTDKYKLNDYVWVYMLNVSSGYLFRNNEHKSVGRSVRCLRD